MAADASRLHAETPNALPVGTRLGEYELLGLLGVGGFGIVYLALDHALEREVAIKEYMPASLAGRTETMHVTLRSQSDAETFALGLKSFVNEARMLARFDHPSLLKVHRFWEANGTAYMAMPVMRGRTVKEVRLAMAAAPDEAWMRALVEPLLGALECLHAGGVYHRDIAPDNIQIEPDGHPVLLDFGAARRVISDKSQTLTAILKPAYAPIEQYAEAGSVKQGPWTDIYALGATLHFVLLGRPPPPATARAVHDDASALTTAALPGCSEAFLQLIDWMLAPRPSDRPQSVSAVRDVLEGRARAPVRRVEPPQPSQWDRTVIMPPLAAQMAPPAAPTATPAEATIDTGSEPTQVLPAASRPPAAAVSAPPRALPAMTAPPVADALAGAMPAAAGRSKRLPIAVGAVAVAVVVAAVAMWPRPAPAPAASLAASAPLVATAPVPAPPSEAPPPAPAQPESKVATVVLPGAGAATAAPPPRSDAAPAAVKVATAPAQASPRSPAERATAPRPAPAAAPSNATTPPVNTAAVAPVPERTRPEAQASAARPSPATVAAPLASAAKLAGPEAICAGSSFLQRIICMERECLRSGMMDHPDCLKWHQNARQGQN